MNKAFALLEKQDLVNDEQIESTIMHRWGIKDILDFNENLLEAMETHPPGDDQLTAFNFIANCDLSAQHEGACIEWGCRLRRVDDLARFAALYSDRVYIQNYFVDYAHAPDSEFDFRYFYTGDLKILLRLRPLLDSGILWLIQTEPGSHMCASCAAKLIPGFKSVSSKLEKQVRALSTEYVPQTHATVLRYSALDDMCTIDVKGPEELYEHGRMMLMGKTPDWLLAKVKASVGTQPPRELKLSPKHIARAGILEARLAPIAHDIWVQHFTSTILGLNAKYLTNRDIDISFLNAITEDVDFTNYNEILRTYLSCQLPVLQNVPLISLLDVRTKEHDAFLLYRNAINEVVKRYISGRKSLSGREAKEIYEDVVYPKLCELTAKVNSLRRSLARKSARDVAITSGIVTIGLFSGLLPLQVLLGLGGLKIAKDVIESIVQAAQTPDEVRNDNFYFLWKLSTKGG